MRQSLVVLFSIAMFFSFGASGVYAEQVQVITENGNVFTIDVLSDGGTEDAAGSSFVSGLGGTIFIEVVEPEGDVIYGSGQNGELTSTRPYLSVPTDIMYAALIENIDAPTVVSIPDFAGKYQYNGGKLTDISSLLPNEIGFAEKITMSGDADASIADGIFITGNSGRVIIELNDYSGQTLLLESAVPAGSKFEIVDSPYDLISLPYVNSKGYLLFSCNCNPSTLDFHVGTSAESNHYGEFTYDRDAGGTFYHGKCCKGGHGHSYSDSISVAPEFVETDDGSGYIKITGDLYNPVPVPDNLYHHGRLLRGEYNTLSNFQYLVYDTFPAKDYLAPRNEMVHTFGAGTKYLVAEPNGNIIQMKGTLIQPDSFVLLEITNLPGDTIYTITKDGIVGQVGKTSPDGKVRFTASQIDAGDSLSGSGELRLYPNPMILIDSSFPSNVMFDTVNNQIKEMPFGSDMLMFPAAYQKISFPVDTNIEHVRVDNIDFDYLERQYSRGESMHIPVIPDTDNIYLTADGTDALIRIENIVGDGGLKLIPAKSATDSRYSVGNPSSVSPVVTTTAFVIAPQTGTMNIQIQGQVSGIVETTINSEYTGDFETVKLCREVRIGVGTTSHVSRVLCHNETRPVDPNAVSNLSTAAQSAIDAGHVSSVTAYLSVYKNANLADIIVNGIPSDATAKIFELNNADAYDPNSAFVTNKAYESTGVMGIDFDSEDFVTFASVDVEAGDFVEVVLVLNQHTDGPPTISSINNVQTSSFASSTVTFEGGSILTGMG